MSNERPPVRKIIVPGTKDENGAYLPETKDLSIDGLLKQGLEAIHGVMRSCLAEAKTGHPSREAVMNLKDAMSMLQALKEQEQEILENMSDEDLKKIVED